MGVFELHPVVVLELHLDFGGGGDFDSDGAAGCGDVARGGDLDVEGCAGLLDGEDALQAVDACDLEGDGAGALACAAVVLGDADGDFFRAFAAGVGDLKPREV